METNYIKWNLPNWITVALMVATMTIAVGFVSQCLRQATGKVATS